MTGEALSRVAGGIRVALRGVHHPSDDLSLRVVGTASIAIPESRPHVGLTPDGQPWRRVWALPDRLVLEYLDVVTVQVEDDGTVFFDEDLPADVEEHLVYDHVLPLFLARRGAVVLHGAVLGSGGAAIVLSGPTGAGKSTLSAYVAQLGWTVGGDDGAVLSFAADVTVEPTYPTVRLTPDAVQLLDLPVDVGRDVAGKRRTEPGSIATTAWTPTRLAAVVHIQPTDGGAGFTRLQGAEAHASLFAVTFHADLGPGGLLRNVVDRLAVLAETVTVGRLAVPRGARGLAAAERILATVIAEGS
ncbi:hypothetical protein [Blastococcus sp. SYSU D00813]